MRHAAKLIGLATSAVVAGGVAAFAIPKVARAAGRPGCSPNNPLPVPSTSGAAKQVPLVAERLRRMWPEVTGESGPMPAGALEIALAQAWLESGVGTWWKDKSSDGGGDMRGSNNLGARQCGANDSGGDFYTCVEYGDSAPNADGTQTYFPAKFRYYKAGTIGGKSRSAEDAAAYDFLYSIVRQWPALAELKAGDVLGYCMKQGPKYRKGDPPDQKVFGREYKGGNGYYGGFGATMEERVGGYGRAILSHLPAIAAALGHKTIQSCIAPELLSKGKAHAAATNGIGEVRTDGDDLDALSARIDAERSERKALNCGEGDDCPDRLRSRCFYCDSASGYAKCHNRACGACGKPWFGPSASSGVGCAEPPDGFAPTDLAVPPDVSAVDEAAILEFGESDGDAELSEADAERFGIEGIGVTIGVSVLAAVAAALVGAFAADALNSSKEDRAADVVTKLRAAGIDYIDPGEKPKKGWVKIQSNDKRLLAALEFLGDKRARVVQDLAAKGFGFQIRPKLKLKRLAQRFNEKQRPEGKASSTIPGPSENQDSPATGLYARLVKEREFIDARKSSAASQDQPGTRRDEQGVLWYAPTTPAVKVTTPVPATPTPDYATIENDRGSIAVLKALPKELEYERLNPDGTTTPIQGMPDTAGFFGGFLTALGVIAAIVAAAGIAAVGVEVGKAAEVVQAMKSAGFEPLEPGKAPRPGWSVVGPDDPRIVKALSFLGEKNAKEVLTGLAAKGWRYQYNAAALPGSIQGEADVTAEAALATNAHATMSGAEGTVIDAVVPAFNESNTIGSVVAALTGANSFGRIIVVDDGSTDDTAERASLAGAEVISLAKNAGKMGAMVAGLGASRADAIAFFDADATNMLPEHARALVDKFKSGSYAQVCGVLDHGLMNTSRLATGQRVVSRKVLEGVPSDCEGYSSETAINYIADQLGGTTETVLLPGLDFRTKREKVGTFEGIMRGARMLGEMAVSRAALSMSGGKSCSLGGPATEGAGKVAIAAGALTAAAAAAGVAYVRMRPPPARMTPEAERERIMLLLQKYGYRTIPESDAIPEGWYPVAGSLAMDPHIATIAAEFSGDSNEGQAALLRLFSSGVSVIRRSEPVTTEGFGSTASVVAAFASGGVVGASVALVASKLDAERKNTTTITPEPPPPEPKRPRLHIVKPGDSPYAIAVSFGASKRPKWWTELTKSNPQKETKGVLPGWKQLLPGETVVIPLEWGGAKPEETGPVTTEGAGTVAAVVAGGLVAGALAAIAIAKAGGAEEAAPEVVASAPPAPPPAAKQAPKKPTFATPSNITAATANLSKVKGELAKLLATIPPDQNAVNVKLVEVKAAEDRLAMLRAATPGASAAKTSAAVDSGDEAAIRASFSGIGEVLSGLYLAGTLPRARAIPGSNGERFVWYIEPAPAADSAPKKKKTVAEQSAEAEANWTPAAQAALEACVKKKGDIVSCAGDESIVSVLKDPAKGRAMIEEQRVEAEEREAQRATQKQNSSGVGSFDIDAEDAKYRFADAVAPGSGLAAQTAVQLAANAPKGKRRKRRKLTEAECAQRVEAARREGQEADLGEIEYEDEEPESLGAAKKQDDFDRAVATGTDITDAAGGIIAAISAGKRIAQREVTVQDPKCRALVKEWVERHPILARFTSPSLTSLAGADIPAWAAAIGAHVTKDGAAVDGSRFVDAYMSELLRQRGERNSPLSNCVVTPEEDASVLSALIPDIGLTVPQEDAIYTASSRGIASIANLFAPGSAGPLTEASDAIATLATGRAPGKAKTQQQKAPKAPSVALVKAKEEAEEQKARADRLQAGINEYVDRHPLITAITSPNLKTLRGVEGDDGEDA